ncbi:VOC family protein [Fodinibius sp. Rm-B-1B1-1]|uniref:VOC family protein n=1 Tax=Fodinibius alkaliphilus TaxID=3140241 RepID=UPI00315A9FF6
MNKNKQKIVPHLWFDRQAEEAVGFYTSLFENSQIGETTRYGEAGQEVHGQKPGSVMTIEFKLAGHQFIALNGGPHFKFTPAISFIVNCELEEEVDELWANLSQGGEPLMPLDEYPFSKKYGWIEDKFGLSWQVILAEGNVPQKIMPSLMFVGEAYGQAEEAINFYTSLFNNSEIKQIARYGPDQEPDKEEAIMYADFKLHGQMFAAMESAHEHDFFFNEAISLLVECESQKEIDYFWENLSAVPEAEQCGWLKDKFGVSWQVAPMILHEMLRDSNTEKVERVTKAFLQMKKFDIQKLQDVYEGNQSVIK